MWEVKSSAPTHVEPGDTLAYAVGVANVGTTASSGTVTVAATLPAEMTGTALTGGGWSCDLGTLTCTRTSAVEPGQTLPPIRLAATVSPSGSGDVTQSVTVSGAGAALPASDTEQTTITPAPPGFGIYDFGGLFAKNAAGDRAEEAGSHPYSFSTSIEVNTVPNPDGLDLAKASGGSVKDLRVDLPRGFVVNPTAVPRCPRAVFADNPGNAPCPLSTQVGIVRLTAGGDVILNARVPVYNMEPPAGVPAQLAFRASDFEVFLDGGLGAAGDYALSASVRNLTQIYEMNDTLLTLWGLPGDDSHDAERGSCVQDGGLCPVDTPPKAFLTMPTACPTAPLTASIQVDSWENPGAFESASFSEDLNGDPIQPTGCGKLHFEPKLRVEATNPKPDSPSGYEVELEVPQNENPAGLATSHLKKAEVTLPEGVSVNPAGAHGLEACSPAQIALNSDAEPTCPGASRIGTVRVDTPLLEDPLTGDVYAATQNDNPFGSLLAMYVVARGPGVIIKLPARVDPDPVTGQLKTTFDDNPQVPFTSFLLKLKGGSTAPLANPSTCGTKTATSSLSPWSGGPAVAPSDTFSIDCPGMSGFVPLFNAGTMTPIGGAFSPFAVRIERPDGQEYVNGLSLEMPPGLTAKLKGVPLCPERHAAAGTCGIESRVGTATVGAGAGSTPFFLRGSVSLTGPYKGAPYGLSVAVPAIAGPYNLGTVVVRQAIFVNPIDARLSVISDPLPTIVQGIPLRLRSINVDIDRPGFVLNPTSCREKQITATLVSTLGSSHQVSQRFQVGDCQALPLRPRLALRLTGRKQTKDGKHPGLRAVLTQRAGQANLKRVAVKLPLSLALDPGNAQALCEFEDGQKVQCPKNSAIGTARAFTPLLNQALTGRVYFVKGVRIDPRTGRRIRTLPTLLIPLRGEVAIDLRARSTVSGRRLVSTFQNLPDAAVSRFVLRLNGGHQGILVVTNNRDLCRGKQVADVDIDGQNGKRADRNVRIRTPCGGKSKRKTRRGRK